MHSDVVTFTLIFLTLTIVLNLVIAILLWLREKNLLYRRLATLWAFYLLTAVVQTFLQQNELMIVLGTMMNYPGTLVLTSLLAILAGTPYPLRFYAVGMGLSVPLTLVAWRLGLSFFWLSLPVASFTALPMIHTSVRTLRAGWASHGGPSFALKGLAVAVLLQGIHNLDFPIFRNNPEAAPIGLFLALLFIFAFSILAPVTIVENQKNKLLLQEEEALRAANASIRARDEFLSAASHELRTPLTPLRLQLQLVEQQVARLASGQTAGAAEFRRAFAIAQRQLDRFSKLVETLLDVVQIESGGLRLSPTAVDLSALVRDEVEFQRPRIEGHGCTIVVQREDPVRGRWDAPRIRQLFGNLLSNAIEFGPGGKIQVDVSSRGGRAILSVRDFGIGISANDRRRIFERFERATPEGHSGLGLGLYIARRIAEAHGGTISVESDLGKGATFTVELPVG